MADFKQAFKITILGNEGGYNPGVGEAETYYGIDRGENPDWSGWKIIDAYKASYKNIPDARMNMYLSQNTGLQNNIIDFYKAGYWDTVKLDEVNDQTLADNLFDCSVNEGEGLAREFMQKAANIVISATKSVIRPLVEDGIIGAQTLGTFNALSPADLNKEINALRLESYKNDKGFSEWGKIWENRLKDYV